MTLPLKSSLKSEKEFKAPKKVRFDDIVIASETKEEESVNYTKQPSTIHLLGIKPYGNRLFDSEKPGFIKDFRERGLGHLNKFSDELMTKLISYFSPEQVINLSLVSPVLYVFSYLDDLWKDRVIEEFNGDFEFKGTWRLTYINKKYKDKIKNINLTSYPIKVKNFYSDYIYQSWMCTCTPITNYLGKDNIDRRSNLSLQEFINEYEIPNKPVIITDMVDQWPAYKKWNREYLIEQYGDIKFRAEAIDIKLKEYFQYADNNLDESPIYLFDKKFGTNCEGILNDFEVPIYFQDDLFKLLKDKRPDYRWLIIGPARSGSTYHKDPNATSAWNAVIKGKKKWILFPPNITPPGIITNKEQSEVTAPVSLMEWHVNYYKYIKEYKPIEAICNEGEVIFVPSGWWHLVVNIEDSIALTQNYVSYQNVEKVLKFLYQKQDQVSGWDCKQESLFEAFSKEYEKVNKQMVDKIKELDNNKLSVWQSLVKDNDNSSFSFGFDFNEQE